jgi:hypothetical protein
MSIVFGRRGIDGMGGQWSASIDAVDPAQQRSMQVERRSFRNDARC